MAAIGYVKLSYARIDIDVEPENRREGIASGALVPGMLAKMDSANKFLAHATQYGKGQVLIVGVNSFTGKDIAETSYAIGDLVFMHAPERGDLCALLLKDGQTIVAGDQLVSNGDGTFKKVNASTDHVFAIAEDALDLSAAGANDLIVARIL